MISKTKGLVRAAAYLRYSSDSQDGSDKQQAEEIDKLAEREGCEIVATFVDKAISGDSGRESRPDLDRMLAAAERGEFQVLLAWDTSRIGRQDSIDAGQLLRVLRDKGIKIVTCRDGSFDLQDSNDRIRYAFLTEGNNAENKRRAYNVTRGLIKNAEAGNRNGAVNNYAMDRVQVTADGQFVRRLKPGKRKDNPNDRVRQVPCEDADRVEAVEFMFTRYATADVSIRQVAREVEAKGFPSPTGKGWTDKAIRYILSHTTYRGGSQWAARPHGKYYSAQGGDVVPADSRTIKDPIAIDDVSEGIVDPKLWDKVQRKLAKNGKRGRKPTYPLSGLLICEHCGKPLSGQHLDRRRGKRRYAYHQYVCSSYLADSKRATCHHYQIDAERVLGWLVPTLREVYIGRGRDYLVDVIKQQLKANGKDGGSDAKRMKKRLAKLDVEVGRLAKAIRVTDAPEVLDELVAARREQDAIKAEMAKQTGIPGNDIDREAERRADELCQLGDILDDTDPATVRELLGKVVHQIHCRWEPFRTTKTGRVRTRLIGGWVYFKESDLFGTLANSTAHLRSSARAGAYPSSSSSSSSLTSYCDAPFAGPHC